MAVSTINGGGISDKRYVLRGVASNKSTVGSVQSSLKSSGIGEVGAKVADTKAGGALRLSLGVSNSLGKSSSLTGLSSSERKNSGSALSVGNTTYKGYGLQAKKTQSLVGNTYGKSTQSDTLTDAKGTLKATDGLSGGKVSGGGKNNGGVLGGVGYTLEKLWLGVVSSVEGIWDYTAGGIADLIGQDEWAKKQFDNDWLDYSHADEWYNPSTGWSFAGDISEGIGSSIPSIATVAGATAIAGASGGTLSPLSAGLISGAVAGLGAAGNSTKEAYRQTGELGGKEYAYGALSGATEAGVEMVSAGLAKGTGRIINRVSGNAVKNTAKSAAKNTASAISRQAIAKGIIKDMGEDFLSEALEEGISEFMSPIYKRMTYDPNAENASVGDIAYASLVGGISGAIMSGGASAVSYATDYRSGNNAIKNGKDGAIMLNSKLFSEREGAFDTGFDVYKNIKSTYESLTESLSRTGGEFKSAEQKATLGQLKRMNAAATLAPFIERSGQRIVLNAESYAELYNDIGIYDKNGNKINITAEDFTKGVDTSLYYSESLSDRKKFARQLRRALTDNQALAVASGMDVTSDALKYKSNLENIENYGKRMISRESFENFKENADKKKKAELGKKLGTKDIESLSYEDFCDAMGKYLTTSEFYSEYEMSRGVGLRSNNQTNRNRGENLRIYGESDKGSNMQLDTLPYNTGGNAGAESVSGANDTGGSSAGITSGQDGQFSQSEKSGKKANDYILQSDKNRGTMNYTTDIDGEYSAGDVSGVNSADKPLGKVLHQNLQDGTDGTSLKENPSGNKIAVKDANGKVTGEISFDDVKELDDDEWHAVSSYKGSKSYNINAELREGNLSADNAFYVENIDRGLEKKPRYVGKSYREITFEGFGDKAALDSYVERHKVGGTVTYKAYTSTTYRRGAYALDGKYVVRHVIYGSSGRLISEYGTDKEFEITYPRNTTFRVIKIKYNSKGTPIIYLEEEIDNEKNNRDDVRRNRRSDIGGNGKGIQIGMGFDDTAGKKEPLFGQTAGMDEGNTTSERLPRGEKTEMDDTDKFQVSGDVTSTQSEMRKMQVLRPLSRRMYPALSGRDSERGTAERGLREVRGEVIDNEKNIGNDGRGKTQIDSGRMARTDRDGKAFDDATGERGNQRRQNTGVDGYEKTSTLSSDNATRDKMLGMQTPFRLSKQRGLRNEMQTVLSGQENTERSTTSRGLREVRGGVDGTNGDLEKSGADRYIDRRKNYGRKESATLSDADGGTENVSVNVRGMEAGRGRRNVLSQNTRSVHADNGLLRRGNNPDIKGTEQVQLGNYENGRERVREDIRQGGQSSVGGKEMVRGSGDGDNLLRTDNSGKRNGNTDISENNGHDIRLGGESRIRRGESETGVLHRGEIKNSQESDKAENFAVDEYAERLKNIKDNIDKIRDVCRGTYSNATEINLKIFENSIGLLGDVYTDGYISERKINSACRKLLSWYNKDNGLLEYTGEENFGFYIDDVRRAIERIASIIYKDGDGDKLGVGKFSASDVDDVYIITSNLLKFAVEYDKVYIDGKYEDAKGVALKFVNIARDNNAMGHGQIPHIFKRYFVSFADPRSVCLAMDGYNENGFYTFMHEKLRRAYTQAGIAEMGIFETYDDFMKNNRKYKKRLSEVISFRGHKMTVGQLISLYLTSKREQAIYGLYENGFAYTDGDGNIVRADVKAKSDGNITPRRAIQDLRLNMEKLFSEQDREYIDILIGILNTTRKTKADRDCEKYGYTRVTKGFYYPIRRAFTARDVSSDNSYILASSPSPDSLSTPGAKQELFIEDADSLIHSHARAVCRYAYVSPISDLFNRIYNLDVSGNKNKADTVKSQTQNIWNYYGGRRGAVHVGEKYFTDMFSPTGTKGVGSEIVSRIRSSYAISVLSFNPKVYLTQISSLFASTSILDYDCLIKGLCISSADIDKYCPAAKLRRYDSTAIKAESVTDRISDVGRVFMKPIDVMDSFVIHRIYAAAQAQVQKSGGGKIGTEENKIEAGKLTEEIIYSTQQNSSPTERSAGMRSESEFMRAITMFSADSMKIFGRVTDSIGAIFSNKAKLNYLHKSMREGKEYTDEIFSDFGDNGGERTTIRDEAQKCESEQSALEKRLARSLFALIGSSLFMALISKLFRRLYRKDKNDTSEEKARDFVFDFVGNLLGGLPLIKDIYESLVSGYDIDSTTYTVINNLITSAKNLIEISAKYASGQAESGDRAKAIRSLVFSLGNATGLPTRNVYNIVYGIIGTNEKAEFYVDDVFENKNYKRSFTDYANEENFEMADMTLSLALKEYMPEYLTGEYALGEYTRGELIRMTKNGGNVLPKNITKKSLDDELSTVVSESDLQSVRRKYARVLPSLCKLTSSKYYRSADDLIKIRQIEALYGIYYKGAISGLDGVEADAEYISAKIIGERLYAVLYARASVIESDYDERGAIIAGSRKKKVIKEIESICGDTCRNGKNEVAIKILALHALGYKYSDGDIDGLSKKRADTILIRYLNTLSISKKYKEVLCTEYDLKLSSSGKFISVA